MSFIDRLLRIMKEQAVSTYRISKDLNISDSLISKWQKNPSIDPSATTVFKISEYLKVNIEWLLNGTGEIYKNCQPSTSSTLMQPSSEDHSDGAISLEENLPVEHYRDMPYMNINDRLFYLLSLYDTTQKEFAEYIGVKSNTVSEWKKRGTMPPSDKLTLICDFFKVDLNWFLTGEGEVDKKIRDSTDIPIAQIPSKEQTTDIMSVDEKLLLENYRDMPEKDQLEVQRHIARKLSLEERDRSTKCLNIENDVEISDELGVG